MNKTNLFLTIILLSFSSGCSLLPFNLFSSPTSVVKNFMSAAENNDVDKMVGLWGIAALNERGTDKIRADARYLADLLVKAKAGGEHLTMQNIKEEIKEDRARVFFNYHDDKGGDSIRLGFALLKENGSWKLYRGLDVYKDVYKKEVESFDNSFAEIKLEKPDSAVPVSNAADSNSGRGNSPEDKAKNSLNNLFSFCSSGENSKAAAMILYTGKDSQRQGKDSLHYEAGGEDKLTTDSICNDINVNIKRSSGYNMTKTEIRSDGKGKEGAICTVAFNQSPNQKGEAFAFLLVKDSYFLIDVDEADIQKTASTSTNSAVSSSSVNSGSPSQSSQPISGGILNERAISLPQPAYPATAKAARASGVVMVQVLVDESGSVTSATATSGHPLLKTAAEQAAREAHFKPTILDGKPMKVNGVLTYNFTAQ